MCLGVPGRIVKVDGDTAIVDFWGVRRQARLDVVDEPVAPGDYILNHAGFAIRRIPEEQVEATLALFAELLEGAQADDLMALDVQGEIDATAAGSGEHRGDRK